LISKKKGFAELLLKAHLRKKGFALSAKNNNYHAVSASQKCEVLNPI
jgi:hypothetical protein